MNVCEIGSKFLSTEKIGFLSNKTFLDYDLVIVDLNVLLQSVNNQSEDKCIKRMKALQEFITHKATRLIVFAPVEHTCMMLTDGRYLEEFHVNGFLPMAEYSVVNETGKRIEIKKGTPFSTFLQKYESHISYQSFFAKFQGDALISTPLANKTLSFYNDRVVFLPKLNDSIKNVEREFLLELYAICRQKSDNNQAVMPPWSEKYLLPREKDLMTEIAQLELEIKSKTEELAVKNIYLSQIRENKFLFTETGEHLEKQVRIIFEDLGFTIHETVSNRDDLIVEYQNKIAVVEIKGVNGSAAEKHAAQLEKWVSTFYEEKGVEPKGILLVNSFRETELKARPEAFPHQMIPYSTKKEHCLLSTLQLMGLYYEVMKTPSQKDAVIASIFTTMGVYQGYKDFTAFIEATE